LAMWASVEWKEPTAGSRHKNEDSRLFRSRRSQRQNVPMVGTRLKKRELSKKPRLKNPGGKGEKRKVGRKSERKSDDGKGRSPPNGGSLFKRTERGKEKSKKGKGTLATANAHAGDRNPKGEQEVDKVLPRTRPKKKRTKRGGGKSLAEVKNKIQSVCSPQKKNKRKVCYEKSPSPGATCEKRGIWGPDKSVYWTSRKRDSKENEPGIWYKAAEKKPTSVGAKKGQVQEKKIKATFKIMAGKNKDRRVMHEGEGASATRECGSLDKIGRKMKREMTLQKNKRKKKNQEPEACNRHLEKKKLKG